MVTLASSTIRGVVTTVSVTDKEIINPTSGNVMTQVVTLDPNATVTLNTSDDAFQVLSDGTVAFLTDLPATTTKQINVLDVLANQYPVTSPVEVTQDASTFTMSNEYYTVTLRKTQNLGTPLTPVASIVPATGTVQLTGGWHHPEWDGIFDAGGIYDTTPSLTGYTFEVLEQGPLLVRVKCTYAFSHNDYFYGATVLIPENAEAFASETIELRAGVNAVFFENESDYVWVSGFNIVNLDVDELRWRGANSSAIAYGYAVVGGTPERYDVNATDHRDRTAIKDLTTPLSFTDYQYNPFITPWNQYATNTGRWVIAREAGAVSGQYVAAIAGAASRALGTSYAGVKYVGGAGDPTKLVYGCYARSPSGTIATYFRYPWALTIGDEPVLSGDEDTTIPEPGLIQNQQIDSTLTKLLRWVPASSSETFHTNSIYIPATQLDALVDRIQSDAAYATSLRTRDPSSATLINYIETPTSGEANSLYDGIITVRDNMHEAHWFGDGYYDLFFAYWQAGLQFLRLTDRIQFLMNDPDLTADQKARIYKTMLLFGHVLADGDFVPTEDPAQFSYGNANAPIQYVQQMDSLHALLLGNPDIATYFDAENFPSRIVTRLNAYVSSYGSGKGSPHYNGTTTPTLNLVQQSYVSGVADLSVSEARLTQFANFCMDLTTPVDGRFGDLRKRMPFGDASLETTEMHGQLAAIFAESNPTLSAKLMEVWDWHESVHNSFYQSSIFKIDDTLPRTSVTLTDAHYPDYMSVFRSGFDTANESAVWFLHGEWYTDHRHYDTGSTYFYLLGEPIALSWGSFYTPNHAGSLINNGLALVSDLTWDGTGGLVPCQNAAGGDYDIVEGSPLFDLNAITYTSSSTRPSTQATFDLDASTTWTRTVMLNKEEVARPVIVIEDTFAGTNAADEKVLNLNLMMTGAVVTPGGNVTPSTTANRATSTSKTALSSGWSTFEFEGQWGVNLILMVYNAASANYQLGRFSHTYSPSYEAAQYLAAVGSAYSEMQYQFRLWSTAASKFVLVPWLASGAKPTVTTSGLDVLVDGDTVT